MTKYKSKICPPNVLNKRTDDNMVDKVTVTIPQEDYNENTVNHIEEVVIGSEQGTTFPTKIGTTLCNALIDTSAT